MKEPVVEVKEDEEQGVGEERLSKTAHRYKICQLRTINTPSGQVP